MKFNEYLKKARIRVGLTQEGAASAIDHVTVNTIQNWEKSTIPDKAYWPSIIEVYGLNKNEFSEKIMDDIISDDNILSNCNLYELPDGLYDDDFYNIVRDRLNFTEDEQELFGMLCFYSKSFISDECCRIAFTDILSELPYEYVKEQGTFNIINIFDSLNYKLKEERDKDGRYRYFCEKKINDYNFKRTRSTGEKSFWIKKFVMECIKDNPSKLFSFDTITPVQHLKFIQGCDSYFDYFGAFEFMDKVKEYQCLIVNIEENEHYTHRISKYDKEKYGHCEYSYMFSFLNRNNFLDDLLEIYVEDSKIDLTRYCLDEDLDLYNFYCKKHNDFMGGPSVTYVKLTDKGERYVDWYRKYIKENDDENNEDEE